MGVYSKEDIIRIVREEEIEFVRLQFTDIFGMLKNVAITASQIEKAVSNQLCSTAPPLRASSASTSLTSTSTRI